MFHYWTSISMARHFTWVRILKYDSLIKIRWKRNDIVGNFTRNKAFSLSIISTRWKRLCPSTRLNVLKPSLSSLSLPLSLLLLSFPALLVLEIKLRNCDGSAAAELLSLAYCSSNVLFARLCIVYKLSRNVCRIDRWRVLQHALRHYPLYNVLLYAQLSRDMKCVS